MAVRAAATSKLREILVALKTSGCCEELRVKDKNTRSSDAPPRGSLEPRLRRLQSGTNEERHCQKAAVGGGHLRLHKLPQTTTGANPNHMGLLPTK